MISFFVKYTTAMVGILDITTRCSGLTAMIARAILSNIPGFES